MHSVAPPTTLTAQVAGYPAHAALITPQAAGYAPLLTAAAGGITGAVGAPPPMMQQPQQRSKLFVGNLPADIQQEALMMVFGHYGSVTNVHIMQGKSRSGQACAFIEYSKPVEAETAILTLHEKYEIRPGEGNIWVKHANQSGPRSNPY